MQFEPSKVDQFIRDGARSIGFSILLCMAAYIIKDNILDHHDRQPEAVTNFGLTNDKQFPLITLCWDEEYFLKSMAEKCGHPSLINELIFHEILQSCLAANMSTDAILDMEGNAYDLIGYVFSGDTLNSWIEIRPFNGSSYFKTSVSGQWSMLIHPKLGPCYTFDIDKSNKIEDILIYPNYANLYVLLHDKHKVPSVSDGHYRTFGLYDTARATKKTLDLQGSDRKCVIRNAVTCSSLMLFDIFWTQFACRSPLLHQGLHLPLKKEVKNMRDCNSQEIFLGLQLHKNLSSSLCMETMECHSVNYEVDGARIWDYYSEPKLRVSLKGLTEEVDSEMSLTPYKTINAIGGMFGLTVGYSLANLRPLFDFIDPNGMGQIKTMTTIAFLLIALDDVAELAAMYQSMPIGVQYIARENNWTRDFPVISLCAFNHKSPSHGVLEHQNAFLDKSEIGQYFDIASMELSSEGQILQIPVSDQFVQITGHPGVGLCYSVNPKLVLNNVTVQEPLTISFEFNVHTFNMDTIEQFTIQAMFHQEQDFLLAKDLSFAPVLGLYRQYHGYSSHNIVLKRTENDYASTKLRPCSIELSPQDSILKMILQEKYKCEVKSKSNYVKECPTDFIYLALDKLKVTKMEFHFLPCRLVTFEKMAHIDPSEGWMNYKPRLSVTVDETVEYYSFFNNFSIRTMVGEGGGALGIFLGICLLDFFDLICTRSSTRTVKLIYRGLTGILAGVVIGMASEVYTEYNNEVEVTSITHVQSPGPIPRITICPTYEYELWLAEEQNFDAGWPMNISKVVEAAIANPKLLPHPLGEGKNFNSGIKVDGSDIAPEFSTMIFSMQYGICFFLDVQRLPALRFSGVENVLILSEGDNVPKATTFQPSFNLFWLNHHHIRLSTKIVDKTPTKRYPCSNEWAIVCREKEIFEEIQKRERCWIPLLYSGPHLKFDKSLKKCSENVTRKYINVNLPSKCPNSTPCRYTRYDVELFTRRFNFYDNGISDYASLTITRKLSTFTEKSDSQWVFMNVLTEMGGLFGVTHGWSAFSLVEALYYVATNWFL